MPLLPCYKIYGYTSLTELARGWRVQLNLVHVRDINNVARVFNQI